MFEYMSAQRKRIKIDKWYEGCRINGDPGSEFVIAWIEKNAASFHSDWDISLCKACQKVTECGFKVKKNCKDFLP